jgi:hypothetical protein
MNVGQAFCLPFFVSVGYPLLRFLNWLKIAKALIERILRARTGAVANLTKLPYERSV